MKEGMSKIKVGGVSRAGDYRQSSQGAQTLLHST